MASKYLCPDCGQEIEADWKACPFCGVIFDEDDDEDEVQETVSTSNIPATPVTPEPSIPETPADPVPSAIQEDFDPFDDFTSDDEPVRLEPAQPEISPTSQSVAQPTPQPAPQPMSQPAPQPTPRPAPRSTPIQPEESFMQEKRVPEQTSEEKWHYSDEQQEETRQEKPAKGLGLPLPKKQTPNPKNTPPEDAYDPNHDHYYDDIKPLIDDAIVHIPKENIMKICGGVAILFATITYLIFYL